MTFFNEDHKLTEKHQRVHQAYDDVYKYEHNPDAEFKKFVAAFYGSGITNGDIVFVIEKHGVSKFLRGLFMYLINSFDEARAYKKYVEISQAYHKSRIYFDEHR